MASASRACRTLGWVILVAALCAAPGLFAQGNFKQLRAEISDLSTKLNDAQKKLNEADSKVNANNREYEDAVKNNPGKAAGIKAEGVKLRSAAETAQQNRDTARKSLQNKQVELRNTAAGHAVKQLSAAGALSERINEMRLALDAFEDALGSLPEVPTVRKADPDPAVQAAQKKGDRDRLTEFDTWASAEESRIKSEIESCDKLINAEAQVKGEDDGPALVQDSKDLKATLQARQKSIGELRRVAQERLKELK